MVAENGNPLSRAKDHNCREAVATTAMQEENRATIMIVAIMVVPAKLCVALKKIWIKGRPVGVLATTSISPQVNINVMAAIRPPAALSMLAQTRARGIVLEESLTSSAVKI